MNRVGVIIIFFFLMEKLNPGEYFSIISKEVVLGKLPGCNWLIPGIPM